MRSLLPFVLAAAAVFAQVPSIGAQFLANPAAALPEPEKISFFSNIGLRASSLTIPIAYTLKDTYSNFSDSTQSVDRSRSGTATYQMDFQSIELGTQDLIMRTHSTIGFGTGKLSSPMPELGGTNDLGAFFYSISSIAGQAGPLVHGWSFSFGWFTYKVSSNVFVPFDVHSYISSFGYGAALLLTKNFHVFAGAMLLNITGDGFGYADASSGGWPSGPLVLASSSSSLNIQSSKSTFAVGGIEILSRTKFGSQLRRTGPTW